MKRIVPVLLVLCLIGVSCGTSRFTFDRTEKNIRELGGTYSKEVGEEISKIYKNGGIEEVIDTVYQVDYQGGDPYVVVEGYLGEESKFRPSASERKSRSSARVAATKASRLSSSIPAAVLVLRDGKMPSFILTMKTTWNSRPLAA